MLGSSARVLALLALAALASGCPSGGGGGGSNEAPVATNDVASTAEETAVVVDVLANDTDPDEDFFFVVAHTDGANGTVTVELGGALQYTPDPDFTGADSFTYTISDGEFPVDATVDVTVSAAGDAPVAVSDDFATAEDTLLTVDAATGVLANDADVDSTGFTAVLDNDVTDGTLALAADGSFTYQPDADFDGADSFSYHATDGAQSSAIVVVDIDVSSVNDAPVADADGAYAATEDTVLVVNAASGVLAGDSDIDGDPLNALVEAGPSDGTLALAADGSFVYTPDPDFTGADSFTYRARDGVATSAPATVSITVAAVNDAPVAAADAFAVTEDATLAAPSVLGNDSDVDSGALTAVLVTGPASASSFTLNADGSFSYQGNTNFNGTDSFVYTANDGAANSASTTVTITVNAANDAPFADADGPYVTNEDTGTAVNAVLGALNGDIDVDGDPLHALLVTGPANGTLALSADGSFGYQPNANFAGLDSFTYRASDGVATSSPATVSLVVNAVNDAPVAASDFFSTAEDTTLAVTLAPFSLLANDVDPEGGSMTAILVGGGPANAASFSLSANGLFTYTPNLNFFGFDSFTYRASDGSALSDVTTVFITVNAVNDPPTFVAAGNVTVAEDSGAATIANWATSLSQGPLGETGQVLSFEVLSGPPGAFAVTPAISQAGILTFTPAPNFFGVTSVSASLLDDGGTPANPADDQRSPPVFFQISVTNVNDAPVVIVGGDRAVLEDSVAYLESGFASYSAGPNGESEPVSLFTNNASGFLFENDCSFPNCGQPSISLDGTLTFKVAPQAFGSAFVTVTATDSFGVQSFQTFTITVTAVNDTPSFTVGSNQAAFDDGAPQTVLNFLSDMSAGPGESDGWTFSVTTNDPGAFTVQPAIDPLGTLTYTPSTAVAPRTAVVSVVMTDDGVPPASSASQSFQITLTNPSAPPALVSSNPANGDAISLAEAFTPGDRLAPMVVVFDDPGLDCALVTVTITGMESGPRTASYGCLGAPGQVHIFFDPLVTDQDGEVIQVDITNIQDTEVPPNPGAPVTILFTYDSQAPTPTFLDDISAFGCRAANTRVVAQFNEPMDTGSDAGFVFDRQPSGPGLPTPVIAEPTGGRGFGSLGTASDVFYFAPRDLLAGGNYDVDVGALTDIAGNASTVAAQSFTVCGGGGPPAPGGVVLDFVELRDGPIVDDTIDDLEIVNGFTLAASLIDGTDDDLDLVFSQILDPGSNAELRIQSTTGGDGPPIIATLTSGDTLRFNLANIAGFSWNTTDRYQVQYNVCAGGGSTCTGRGFTLRVKRAGDSTNPRVVAVAGRRASSSDPAMPLLRPEEAFRVGFSEAVDRRTVTPSSFLLEDSLGSPVPLLVLDGNSGGLNAEIALLRADRGDGTPGALAPGLYTLTVSGVLDLGDPQNALVTDVRQIEVATRPGAASFLISLPFGGQTELDPAAGTIFALFNDAMSRSSFVDTGDPGVTPRGFELLERLTGTFSVDIPLKGFSALPSSSTASNGNGDQGQEPEAVALSVQSCCGPSPQLNGFRAGRTYLITLLADLLDADGDPLGVDAPQFAISMSGDLDNVRPTITEYRVDLTYFPPGLLFEGAPLESRGEISVYFEDEDVFGNGNNEQETLTVAVGANGSRVFGPAQTLSFTNQNGAILDAADLAVLFPTPGVFEEIDYFVEDGALNQAFAADLLWIPGTPSAPVVTPTGAGFAFAGAVAAPDADFVQSVEVGILLTDESGPTPNVVGVGYSALAQVSRDGSGSLTYRLLADDLVLPDISPLQYRAFMVASVPAFVGGGQSGVRTFSSPSDPFTGNGPPPPPPPPFFSEYLEGVSNNKAIEIYNPALVSQDLSVCSVRFYFNGLLTVGATIPLSGTIPSGGVFVVCDNNSVAGILDVCDLQSTAAFFNGDDAVELVCNSTRLDVIGQIGFDPGTEWGSGLASTADNSLVRKCAVTAGDSEGDDPFTPSFEWGGFVVSTSGDLGLAGCVP